MATFEDTVKNLLRMKPKPHEKVEAPKEDQSESHNESSKERNKR